jgi:hypothetical protein
MNEKPIQGYTDTPVLPGTSWTVHDPRRPQPRVVTPAPYDRPFDPPSDAIILFNGRDLSAWTGRDGEARWKVENGHVEVAPKTGNIWTRENFGDGHYHIEWAAPTVIKGEGQGRGNSGVFLMRLYEVQVLDGYENRTYADGTTAAIYGQFPPLVNACRRPGEWQTYDIFWCGPRFEGERLVRPARITVVFNGIPVHVCRELMGPTEHRKLPAYRPHSEAAPLELQDHGDLVRYRNIWYRPF